MDVSTVVALLIGINSTWVAVLGIAARMTWQLRQRVDRLEREHRDCLARLDETTSKLNAIEARWMVEDRGADLWTPDDAS